MTDQQHLPDERPSMTVKLAIHGQIEGYIHLGTYPDGRIGEVGMVFGQKHGDTIRGLLDGVSAAVSIGLQYGVPLSVFVDKFSWTRFPPSGMTGNETIRQACSILDLVFRYIGNRFPDGKIPLDLLVKSGVKESEQRKQGETCEEKQGRNQ